MAGQQRIDVGAVLCVETDDLELRHEHVRGGQRVGPLVEVICDRQVVAHREAPDEDVDLAAVDVVEVKQPARAVERVELLVAAIPGPLQQLGERACVTL